MSYRERDDKGYRARSRSPRRDGKYWSSLDPSPASACQHSELTTDREGRYGGDRDAPRPDPRERDVRRYADDDDYRRPPRGEPRERDYDRDRDRDRDRGDRGGRGGYGRGGGGRGGRGGGRDYRDDRDSRDGRDRDDRGDYGRYGRDERDWDRDRPLDRNAIAEARRRREEERARGVKYAEDGTKIEPKEEEEEEQEEAQPDEEVDEEQAAIAAMMGFGGFGTTKVSLTALA